MKKELIVILAAVAILLCVVFSAGCTGYDDTGDTLAGKWVTHDGAISLICNNDGTGTLKFNTIKNPTIPVYNQIVWKKLDVSDILEISPGTSVERIQNHDFYEVYSPENRNYVDMFIGVNTTEYFTTHIGQWLTPLNDGNTLYFVTYDEFADHYGIYPS